MHRRDLPRYRRGREDGRIHFIRSLRGLSFPPRGRWPISVRPGSAGTWHAARRCASPDVPGLAEITSAPPEIRLSRHVEAALPARRRGGSGAAGLRRGGRCRWPRRPRPAAATWLGLARIGRFLVLTPVGDGAEISRLAATLVAGLDAFRAPPGPDELARRRRRGLTAGQEALAGALGATLT